MDAIKLSVLPDTAPWDMRPILSSPRASSGAATSIGPRSRRPSSSGSVFPPRSVCGYGALQQDEDKDVSSTVDPGERVHGRPCSNSRMKTDASDEALSDSSSNSAFSVEGWAAGNDGSYDVGFLWNPKRIKESVLQLLLVLLVCISAKEL